MSSLLLPPTSKQVKEESVIPSLRLLRRQRWLLYLQITATLCWSLTPPVRMVAQEVREDDRFVSMLAATEKSEDKKDWADDDYDGLPNWLEDQIGTDRFNPDTDGDGIFDGDEVFLTGTDPRHRSFAVGQQWQRLLGLRGLASSLETQKRCRQGTRRGARA